MDGIDSNVSATTNNSFENTDNSGSPKPVHQISTPVAGVSPAKIQLISNRPLSPIEHEKSTLVKIGNRLKHKINKLKNTTDDLLQFSDSEFSPSKEDEGDSDIEEGATAELKLGRESDSTTKQESQKADNIYTEIIDQKSTADNYDCRLPCTDDSKLLANNKCFDCTIENAISKELQSEIEEEFYVPSHLCDHELHRSRLGKPSDTDKRESSLFQVNKLSDLSSIACQVGDSIDGSAGSLSDIDPLEDICNLYGENNSQIKLLNEHLNSHKIKADLEGHTKELLDLKAQLEKGDCNLDDLKGDLRELSFKLDFASERVDTVLLKVGNNDNRAPPRQRVLMANPIDPMTLLLLSNEISSFDGNTDARGFLDDFIEKADILPAAQKCSLFGKKLKKNAEFWFRALDNGTKRAWAPLERDFRAKYVRGQQTFFSEKKLHDLKQTSGQSVDDFILDVRKMCRSLDKGDDEIINHVILNSNPDIQKYLIERHHAINNINELETMAKRGELLNGHESGKMACLLSDAVEKMELAALQVNEAVSQGNDRRPSEARQDDQFRGRRDDRPNMEFRRMACYSCGATDHLFRECPTRANYRPPNYRPPNYRPPNYRSNTPSRTERQDVRPRTCYSCGDQGHLKYDCPKTRREYEDRRGQRTSANRLNFRPPMTR